MEDEFIPIIVIASIVGSFFMMRTVVRGLVQIVCHWRDVSLKMRLVDQGVGADEIERIVLAGRGSETLPPAPEPAVKKPRPATVYANG